MGQALDPFILIKRQPKLTATRHHLLERKKNITVEPTQPDWKIESSLGPQAAAEPALSEQM